MVVAINSGLEQAGVLPRQENNRSLIDGFGGVILRSPKQLNGFNFMATLSSSDQLIRFFPIADEKLMVIETGGGIYLFEADWIAFLEIKNGILKMTYGRERIIAGCYGENMVKEMVYGFKEIPEVIGRGSRIAESAGFRPVHVPLGKIDDHRAIRVVK